MSSSLYLSSNDVILVILNLPVVRVPVLSKAILVIFLILSNTSLPLIRIPFLLATPIPEKYDSGTLIAIARGHDITRYFNALYIFLI